MGEMKKRIVVFISDMGGVLIQCRGYIQAFIDTLKTTREHMGLAN